MSGALVRHTGPGDTLLLGPPDGGMTLDPGSDRPLLLAGGGTGLAPMKALAEQAIASGRDCDVHLLVAARHATGLYDLPELRLLESHHPRLRVVPVLSRGTAADDLSGRVPDVLPRLLEGVSGRDEHEAYVAGPVPMVRETVTALQRLGVPLARIRHDLLAAAADARDHMPARSRRKSAVSRSAG
ncbi:hypothetical protein LUX39_02350 [Actinomadura madurae]|nr:hypothetical protein [Actinomadura madurae]